METRLNIDPVSKDVRVEVTKTVEVKEVLDEKKLLRKKDYLEKAISDFQLELDKVNDDLTTITNAKNG